MTAPDVDDDDELDGDDYDDVFDLDYFVDEATFAIGIAESDSRRWDPSSVAVIANEDEGTYVVRHDVSISQSEGEGELDPEESALTVALTILSEHVASSQGEDAIAWTLCVAPVDAETFRNRDALSLDELRALPGAIVEEMGTEDEEEEWDEEGEEEDDEAEPGDQAE